MSKQSIIKELQKRTDDILSGKNPSAHDLVCAEVASCNSKDKHRGTHEGEHIACRQVTECDSFDLSQTEQIDKLKNDIDKVLNASTNKQTSLDSTFESSLKTDPTQLALRRILKLVNFRDRSIAEVRARLQREEFDDASIENAIARACELNILDDMRYADLLVRSRINQNKGIDGVVRELEKHDIDPYILSGWPDSYTTSESEYDRALNLLLSKPPRSKNPQQSAYSKLMRKGFSSNVAASVARNWAENHR